MFFHTSLSYNDLMLETEVTMGRRKKTVEEQIKQGVLDLAVGNISDAVSLLYLSDDEVLARLPKLNLFNVSEIKRPKGGGMEIKFFDRLKAFEKLEQQSRAKSDEGIGFYQALEKSALKLNGDVND